MGNKLLNHPGEGFYAHYPVVDDVNLAPAIDFPVHCILDQLFLEITDLGVDGFTVGRGCVNKREVAKTGKCLKKSAGDGGG